MSRCYSFLPIGANQEKSMGAKISALFNELAHQRANQARLSQLRAEIANRNLEASPRYPIPVPPYEELEPFVKEILDKHLPFQFSLLALNKLHMDMHWQDLNIVRAKSDINRHCQWANICGYCRKLKFASIELRAYLERGEAVPAIATLARIYSLDSSKDILDGLRYKRTDYEELSKMLERVESKNETKVLTYAVELARYAHDFPTHCPKCQAELSPELERGIIPEPERGIIPGDQVICPKCKRKTNILFDPQVEKVEPEVTDTIPNPVLPPTFLQAQAIHQYQDKVSHTPFTFLEYAACKLRHDVQRFVNFDVQCRDTVLAKTLVDFVQRLGPLAGYFKFNIECDDYMLGVLNWIPEKQVGEADYDLVYRITWLSNEFNIPLPEHELLLFLDELYPAIPSRITKRRLLIALMNPFISPLDLRKVREVVYDMVREVVPEYDQDKQEDYAWRFIMVVLGCNVEDGVRTVRVSTYPEVVDSIVRIMAMRGSRPDRFTKDTVFTTLFRLKPIPSAEKALLG